MPPLEFQRIDENLAKREINKLECLKSPGHDQIPVKVIKDAIEMLIKPLATIVNSSMKEGSPRLLETSDGSSNFQNRTKT